MSLYLGSKLKAGRYAVIRKVAEDYFGNVYRGVDGNTLKAVIIREFAPKPRGNDSQADSPVAGRASDFDAEQIRKQFVEQCQSISQVDADLFEEPWGLFFVMPDCSNPELLDKTSAHAYFPERYPDPKAAPVFAGSVPQPPVVPVAPQPGPISAPVHNAAMPQLQEQPLESGQILTQNQELDEATVAAVPDSSGESEVPVSSYEVPKKKKGCLKRSLLGCGIIIVLAVVLGAIAGGVWFFVFKDGGEQAASDGIQYNAKANAIVFGGKRYDLVQINGQSFRMGQSIDVPWTCANEAPDHLVELSAYSIGKTEVPQWLWVAVMGENPSYFQGENMPVEQVSYNDALVFIERLNNATGEKFRLPTEAEWECAAMGRSSFAYSGSDSACEVGWVADNSGRLPHDVMSLEPNGYGIYDMSGNVAEWTADYFGRYRKSDNKDPKGPSLSASEQRVTRGGDFERDSIYSRVKARTPVEEKTASRTLGFRIVK